MIEDNHWSGHWKPLSWKALTNKAQKAPKEKHGLDQDRDCLTNQNIAKAEQENAERTCPRRINYAHAKKQTNEEKVKQSGKEELTREREKDNTKITDGIDTKQKP